MDFFQALNVSDVTIDGNQAVEVLPRFHWVEILLIQRLIFWFHKS